MNGFYRVTDKIRETLQADVNVNTVTYGDITQVDLDKQTIFPLSHIIVNSVTSNDTVLTFNISVLAMDIVDVSKEEVTNIFVGNNNEQDVLNTMLQVANKLWSDLSRGDLYTDKYRIEGTPTCEPFVERFDNQLAGWDLTIAISIPNSDISVCV